MRQSLFPTMMIESLEEYLDTVAGYIYDSDKLVTYKWLSKELEVHVNTAKQILWEFVQRQHENKLECTYLLIGTLHKGGIRVEVIKEADLTEAKKKYSNVISEHIYSLQKTLPDIELLAISGDGDTRFSAIKCNECVERTDEEFRALRWGAFTAPLEAQHKTNTSENVKQTSESVPEHTSNFEVKSKKGSTETKKNVSSHKKGFNSLFGKANTKKSPPTIQKRTDTSPKETFPKKKIEKGALDSFLGQSKNQPASAESSVNQDKTGSTTPKDSEKKTTTSLENSNKMEKESRGQKRNRSKETRPTSKRLKRITIQSDSSDSDSSHEVDENVRDPTPSPERHSPAKANSPSPPRVKHKGGKRKVLKLVDKTYEEDGFLVTKKVHVYESCSEEEPEIMDDKKPVTTDSRLEPKGKKNTKQTTLMSFFKKS